MTRRKIVELARPGDPIITRYGVKINPILPRTADRLDNLPVPIGETRSNTNVHPPAFRSAKRQNIKDLPAPTNIINGIAATFMYTILGVGDREIADTLNITTMQLEELREHSAYSECFHRVIDELISANSDAIQARISSYAVKAVDNIMNVADTAEDEGLKLRANQDIADRAGVGAKQLAERKVSQQSTLRIMVIDEEKSISVNLDLGA
jgi:hypothetical protein